MLVHGITASGPMDRGAFGRAGRWAGASGEAGIEFTMAGLELVVTEGRLAAGWDGGHFALTINGTAQDWPGRGELVAGDVLAITPGEGGNYGYLQFGASIELPRVLGSFATNTRARIGGLDGRALRPGDELTLIGEGQAGQDVPTVADEAGPIRFMWGLHADQFSDAVTQRFPGAEFVVTRTLDRMGVRLEDRAGVFSGASILSLVSEPVVPGDIQIQGDGTPVVLMRDHQSTGGYPRIGTVISADLDRVAQMRPGTALAFEPVSVEHAHRLLRSSET